MDKKGFTLIELLAIIVILAVIALIASPRIVETIEKSRIESYKQNMQTLIEISKKYVLLNRARLDLKLGESIEITLADLINADLIDKIDSPWGDNGCNGYIIVTKLSDKDIDYNPHLNCFANIGDNSEDGLIVHYKFDDFQEPTENIANLRISGMNNITYKQVGKENGYDKYSISGTWNSGSYPYSFNLGSNYYNANKSYSVSCEIYTNVKEKFTSDFGVINIVNDSNMTGLRTLVRNDNYSARMDYIHSINMSNPSYIISRPIANGTTFDPNTDFVYVKNYQVEEKPYATPYTFSIREGIIKDYSSNGNDGLLEKTTTPRWVDNCYSFDGFNDFIALDQDFNNFGNEGDFSISAWIKPSNNKRSAIISSGYLQTEYGRFGLYSDGVYVRDGGNNHINALSVDHFDNKWHQIIGVFNRSQNKIIFIVDGKLKSSSNWNGTLSYDTGDMSIGNLIRPSGINEFYFNGLIDDVKMYNRALTIEETEKNYNIDLVNYVK
ncbi:MAG: prepilin-type N-terminal cleavage/methylation domain-containing protein [Bacilli bacterium]|nr:prepilin-type N-terminal cleavage/methylation domain-containing protein [Bacilli bacterium]MDD4734048.1 prepilin-type N-terminal cleavage/methylation domain-containing protein [Bacilli bacterium]